MAKQARPRLAYVVNDLNPGGAERLVVDMVRAFAGEYDVAVFCLDEPGSWAGSLRQAGVPVHGLWRQPGLDVSVSVRLASHFRAMRVDIVHAHQCSAWFYAALSRLLYPSPRLVFEEHGRFYPEPDKPMRRLVNRVLIARLTHRFVAVSMDIRRRLERYEGLDAGRIDVVYNGVAEAPRLEAAARAGLRAQFGFGPDDFVVGTVGRFDPVKNLPMLVSSIAESAPELPSVRGLLVGDGPAWPAIRRQVDAAGLAERVRLTGHREDARALVQCLDLFVLGSFSEGTSMALLEAMAAGIPVAVTDVGGNPEIVRDGATGWVIPSGDGTALVDVVRQAASDPALCRRFAEAGRQRYLQQFSLSAMLEAYRRIYAQLGARAGRVLTGAGA